MSHPRPGDGTAPRVAVVDWLHGRPVDDPYRWLEDATDRRTATWLADQDRRFAAYLAGLPGRDVLAARLAELHDVGSAGLPAWRGQRWFATRREAGQEVDVLYTGDATTERVLVDPNAVDPSGRTTVDGWEPDHEGRLLAYRTGRDGTEETVLWVVDVASGEVVDGPIERTRHGSLAWLPGGRAFYYVRRLPPDEVPPGEEQYHRRVYLHRVGTPADADTLVFGQGGSKSTLYGVSVGPDGRWLIVACTDGAAPRNDVWIADLRADAEHRPRFRPVQVGVDAHTRARTGRDGRLYLLTNLGAPRGRLAVTDPADPAPETWRDLLPEDPTAILDGYALLEPPGVAPLLLAARARHAVSELTTHDAGTGRLLGTVELPGRGTVTGLAEHPDGSGTAWFGYTDFGTPETPLCYDARAGAVRAWRHPPGSTAPPRTETRQLQCRSPDGTTVRLFLVGQPAALDERAGPRALLLYGYGGFGVSLTPRYSPLAQAWVAAGGLYAVAGLRGGGEEGERWHRAGMRESKQNTFADLYAAAGMLVTAGYTTPRRLCVYGGSNGGLLVGAAVTQRPDLFAAALCRAPLLDMVRYERFGLGRMWTGEYGSANDPEQFDWLLSYSPYHHVRDGTPYPAVLFLTFDGDTRVHPMHAWKTCAALQHATASPDRPILLRREPHVGHGTRAVSRTVALGADILAFAAANTHLWCRAGAGGHVCTCTTLSSGNALP